jgi:hypothetical protein
MNASWLRLGCLLVLSTIVATGCVENDRTLIILRNYPLTDDCMAEMPSEGDPFRSRGLLDLGHAYFNNEPFYLLNPLVRNTLPTRSDVTTSGVTDPMLVAFDGFEIGYEWLKGEEVLNVSNYQNLLLLEDQEDFVWIGDVMESGGDTGGGSEVFFGGVPVIPPDVGTRLAVLDQDAVSKVTLGVKVKLVGTTLGGTHVESNTFVYPITFCKSDATASPPIVCLELYCPAGSNRAYPSCTPGQDYIDQDVCNL